MNKNQKAFIQEDKFEDVICLWWPCLLGCSELSHRGLVAPYSISDLKHQAITWTNADLLTIKFLGTNLMKFFLSKYEKFHSENVFENVVCKILAILFRSQIKLIWLNFLINMLFEFHLTKVYSF